MTRSEAGKLGYIKAKEKLALLRQNKLKNDKQNYITKHCLFCNAEILFENRELKFCNSSCSAKYNNPSHRKRKIERPKTYCKSCNKELDGYKRYVSIYCSTKCQQDYECKLYIEDWLNNKNNGSQKDGHFSNTVKRYILENRQNKCEECGWCEINKYSGKTTLEIHHEDGNHKNNTPLNLKLLCPNCHSLTQSYKGLNSGNGRAFRRKRYAEGKSY